MLTAKAKIQYIRMIFRVEAIRCFDVLCDQVGSTTIAHLNQVILGLGAYFFPVNYLSKNIF